MNEVGGDVLDESVLRHAFACFPSGVTAVCAMVSDSVGMAASSFTSVSIDPPLVSVCVANSSATWAAMRDCDRLGISVLGSDHGHACRQLAAREGDRFAGLAWWPTSSGAVLFEGAPLQLECSIEQEVPGGDHLIVLLRIHSVVADPSIAPLVFHGSRFRQLVPDTWSTS